MLSKRYAQPDRRRCVSCGACTKECPRDAIHIFRGCYAKVDEIKCIGCKKCMTTGCPALRFNLKDKKSEIVESDCVGCRVCAQVCPVKAISRKGYK